MQRKHLSTILRLVIAAFGVAYIAWMVDLADHVEFPAGTVLPGGEALVKPASFRVVGGAYEPTNPSGQLTVELELADGSRPTMPVTMPQLTDPSTKTKFVPGLVTMLKQADMVQLFGGLVVVGLIYPVLTVRWQMLMRAREMMVTLWKTFRITMVGNFFNFFMPGTTGGDVIKAYYTAKGSGRRADAVMTVVVDRVCGLLGLLILAGVAGLFMLHDPTARAITAQVWLICAGFAVGCVVYFSRRIRRALRVDWLLSKLPAQRIMASVDHAAFAYRGHKTQVVVAVMMSVGVHVVLVVATAMAGYALGMQTPIGLLMIVIPVAFLIGALPVSPQGIGLMEFFTVTALARSGAFPNQVVGMLIMTRVYQMVYSLLGSVFLLQGDIQLHPQEDDEPATGE